MSSKGRWVVYKTVRGVSHVVPLDDFKEHDASDCWCKPHDYEGIIVHNSMDRREEFEPDYLFGSARRMS